MSEYQYYEFAAVDEPLTDKQMEKLRAISTRAEITPTRLVNEYQWGNFKGDPRKLIVDYFDAFLYYANWGTLWCMFRLPKDAVDVAALKRFDTVGAIDVWTKGKYVVVDICLDDDSGDYDVPYEQTLGELLPIRVPLLEGALGPLYIAWLAAVQRHIVEDDTVEPCDAADLGPLDAATRSLARFLCVKDELLKAAYGSVSKKIRIDKPSDVAKWARTLPQKEKDDFLEAFIAEPANVVRSKVLKRYRAMHPGATDDKKSILRTAAQLRVAADIDGSVD